jgi:hypothetical protein
MSTDTSEKCDASIYRVEETKGESNRKQAACRALVLFLSVRF